MEREKHDQYSEYKQVMANADPPHSQFMELIDVARSLSEKNRIQLISRSLVAALRVLFENELTFLDTLVLLVRNQYFSISNIRDINLVTWRTRPIHMVLT
jgi:hypothetical protein